jgi:hypothetical protein
MFGRKWGGMPGEAVALIWFPARLLLRKLGGEGSDYFAGAGDLTGLSQSENQAPKDRRNLSAADRSAQLLDLGEVTVEILAFGSFILAQPGLH